MNDRRTKLADRGFRLACLATVMLWLTVFATPTRLMYPREEWNLFVLQAAVTVFGLLSGIEAMLNARTLKRRRQTLGLFLLIGCGVLALLRPRLN